MCVFVNQIIEERRPRLPHPFGRQGLGFGVGPVDKMVGVFLTATLITYKILQVVEVLSDGVRQQFLLGELSAR
ncbi:MAG: hypothetical protein M3362_08830 [Acidobacteriota bacterium]|nr:hypothetical protein [Acidobacteriota bacterium]